MNRDVLVSAIFSFVLILTLPFMSLIANKIGLNAYQPIFVLIASVSAWYLGRAHQLEKIKFARETLKPLAKKELIEDGYIEEDGYEDQGNSCVENKIRGYG